MHARKSRMDETRDIAYIKGIVRRRKKIFLVILTAVFLLSATVAFVLPPIYLSKSTILIEGQQIPQEYVQSTITGYVEERLQIITQRIMSYAHLSDIIRRFNLYRDLQDRYTRSEIIEKMRDDITLETISADVIDRRTGRPTAATIAFTLSYEGKDPATVQRVANVLASLYLEENLKNREERAAGTAAFLQQELEELNGQINLLESKISEFKKTHLEELPEYTQINIQVISRLDSELTRIDMHINALKERKILLAGQIANVDPLSPIITEDGRTMMNPAERLRQLRLQLTSYRGIMSDQHPDMIQLKTQIKELESEVDASGDTTKKLHHLNNLRSTLTAMRGKMGERHPDVVKLAKQIDILEADIKQTKSKDVIRDTARQHSDNPAYINLMTQIETTELEIKNLLLEKQKLEREQETYREKIEKSPRVEKEYNVLLRDYEMARYKYREIMNKHMEAKVAQGMEETQHGEKFTIVDPAQLPEKPFKPNIPAILLIGFVLAFGSAVGGAAAREALDTTIKSTDQINALTAVTILGGLAVVKTDEEILKLKRRKLFLLGAAAAGVVLLLVVVNYFVMPLDILWIKIHRKAMLYM